MSQSIVEALESRRLFASVTSVFVNGTAWTTSFRNFLGSSGAGDATFGYRLDAANHADELSWTNLNQVSVRFNEDVVLASEDLVVRGVTNATYAISAFSYDPATFTATWTLPSAVPADKLLLDLDSGADGVKDLAGNPLDGEWTNPTPPASGGADAFPSGNGTPGSDFRFRLNLLPGDAERDGDVDDPGDATLVRDAQGSPPGSALYSIFKDVNGTGTILSSDVSSVRLRLGTTLPPGEPAAPLSTATVTGASQVNEGSSLILALGTSDPADTNGWFIDWGDGSDPDDDGNVGENLVGNPASATHTYADGDASRVITATAFVDGVYVDAPPVPIAVANVAPVLQPLTAHTYNVGDTVLLSALLTDPGILDTHTVEVNWGDSTITAGTVVDRSIAASHVFATAGVYLVTVTVEDGDGGSDSQSFFAEVTSIPPAAPTGFSVSGTAWIDGVTFTWQDNADDEDGFLIEWFDGEGFIILNELGTNTTSYTDEFPRFGANQYRVRAFRGRTEVLTSEPSETVIVTPIAPPVGWYDDNAGANDRETLAKYVTPHNHPLSFDPRENDADYDGGPISIESYTSPDHGTVLLNPNGTFTYTPESEFVGSDQFSYVIVDGSAQSIEAHVAIDITNSVPRAQSDDLPYDPGFYISLQGQVVFTNDAQQRYVLEGQLSAHDGDSGDTLTYQVVANPSNGDLTLESGTGDFRYNPGPGFRGADKFTYVVSDGHTSSLPATITITQWMGSASSLLYVSQPSPIVFGEIPNDIDFGYEILTAPAHGAITTVLGSNNKYELRYEGDGQPDYFVYRDKSFGGWGSPQTCVVNTGHNDFPVILSFDVDAEQETTHVGGIGSVLSYLGCTYTLGQNSQHGTVTLLPDDGFTFTPTPDPATGESYRGLDSFTLRVVDSRFGVEFDLVVALSIGRQEFAWPQVTLKVPGQELNDEWEPHAFPPTREGLEAGYETCKSMLASLLNDLVALGQAVKNVDLSSDEELLGKLDVASGYIDPLAEKYDQYLSQIAGIAKAAGAFLADQWFISQADADAVANINRLPTKVGSLKASKEKMQELADALAAQGEGAAIAVDTANKVVRFAEISHKVLTTAEIAGGVTVLVKTGATLIVKEGIKACAKQAAKELTQQAASAVAAEMANYAAELAGIPQEYRQYIAIGVDAYQTFAFLKAARVNMRPSGACFATGTQVIVGVNDDGSLITKDIEEVEIGDFVLSRDQYDAGDDLDTRQVARVFRKTSDHIRVLRIEGDDGNVETIRTTDEHPFYVQDKGWLGAGDLSIGDTVQETDGTWQLVSGSERQELAGGITVYNFEVEGDHTYFVEDGAGAADAVWVHNQCVGGKFFGTYGGKPIEFKNSSPSTIVFRKRAAAETDALRTAFSGTLEGGFVDGVRGDFIRHVANTRPADLRAAGFSDPDINWMKTSGRLPEKPPEFKCEVHHKIPLDGGGDNAFDNLIIIRQRPYHAALNAEQQRYVGDLEVGAEKEIEFPLFSGMVVYTGD